MVQEPRQIFDNLYWVGNNSRNSWVIKTSAGLIVVDTLFHYSVEPEIVDGIKKLGMDPQDDQICPHQPWPWRP